MKNSDTPKKHGLWERLLCLISPTHRRLADLRNEYASLKSELYRLTNADAAFSLAMENNTNTVELRNEIGKIKMLLFGKLMPEIKSEIRAVESRTLTAYEKELSKSKEELCVDMGKIFDISPILGTLSQIDSMMQTIRSNIADFHIGIEKIIEENYEWTASLTKRIMGDGKAVSENLIRIEKQIAIMADLHTRFDKLQEMLLHPTTGVATLRVDVYKAIDELKTQIASIYLQLSEVADGTQGWREPLNDAVVELSAVLDDIRTILMSNSTIIGELQDTLPHKIENIQIAVSAENEKNARERMHFKDDMEMFFVNKFMNELSTMDYRQKYLRLISDLDSSGRATVSNILRRIAEVHQSNGIACLDLLSSNEIRRRREIMTKFWLSVVKISDSCWAYNEYLLPIEYFETGVFFYEYGIPELGNKELICERDIIDAGAFIGDSSLVMSKYTNGNVHAFEPMQTNFNYLLQTIEMNATKNIIPHQIGLGRKNEKKKFYTQGPASGEVQISKIGSNEQDENVQLLSLDSFVHKNHITVGLIKADLEGGERDMLLGAKETILRDKPVLIISIYHSAHDFFDIKTMLESWNTGYRFTVKKFPDHYILIDTLLIAEPV